MYANPDPRTYPMSSYSYMIVPTTTAAPFNADKGATLEQVHPLLRVRGPAEGRAARLLAAAAEPRAGSRSTSVRKIPGHVDPPPIDQCDNPTITGSFVTDNAPPPPPSDHQGTTPPTTAAPATSNNHRAARSTGSCSSR